MEQPREPIAPVVSALSPADAAETRIKHGLLNLAREIRRERAYIGYSAFIMMGLLTNTRPLAWEGRVLVDLIAEFAPWATPHCTKECPVQAVVGTLVATPEGYAKLLPISEDHPLSECRHFVASAKIVDAAVAGTQRAATEFEELYASLGVVVLGTVVDGDCGIDVMTMMLSRPSTAAARKQLRIELSDYLISRVSEAWMLDLMVCCGELRAEDVVDFRKGGAEAIVVPTAPAAAVAETESQAMGTAIETKVDDETYEAMCWASGLKQTAHVLGLIHSLPPEIVNEQVLLYRDRKSKPAVAEPNAKITVTSTAHYQIRSVIAAAFHAYCRHHGLDVDARMPRDAVTNFNRTRIEWKGKGKPITGRNVRRWHATWSADPANAAKKKSRRPERSPQGLQDRTAIPLWRAKTIAKAKASR